MSDPLPPPNPFEPAEASVDLTGRTLGDYAVLRKIGQGGMGQVYLARQQSLKREVALKILRKELAANAVALKRFQAEAEAVARISHPNIVQVYAVGVEDGLNFMALEYVEGRNLREYLERKGPPELPVALAILKQIAAALQRAGELGLVHRDIKPENVLLNRKAEVKVTDFGLSCYFAGEDKPLSLTQSGMTLGTPLYMSPEQVQGRPVDHRSDLYSFGVTAYHLLAGHPPYTGLNAFDVAVQHVQATPEPLGAIRADLPAELTALVTKLMAKRAEDRYQSAREVQRELARIQRGGPASEPPPTSESDAHRNLSITLSGDGIDGVRVSESIPLVPDRRRSLRWPLRLLGVGALTLAAYAGWRTHAPQLAREAATIATAPGLPEARAGGAIVVARELALRDKFKQRPMVPAGMAAGMELGLICVQERRFVEADAVFEELEGLKSPGGPGPNLALAVGKFGKGIVLAHRDLPLDSNRAFEEAVAAVKLKDNRHIIERFFFDHAEFGLAISEALNRNAENLANAKDKMPSGLDWMRSPAGLLRIRTPK